MPGKLVLMRIVSEAAEIGYLRMCTKKLEPESDELFYVTCSYGKCRAVVIGKLSRESVGRDQS
jgi:hypothetical protein